MSAQDRRVCVGVVTGAHGVRGAVRIKSFTAEPEDVASYGPLEDESGERRFTLRIVGSAKGVLIAAISGIDDRDRAEALRGLRLYLPRSALPPTGRGRILPRRPDRARSGAGRRHADRHGARGARFRRRRHARNRARRGAAGDGAVHPGGRADRRFRCRPARCRSAAGLLEPRRRAPSLPRGEGG